MTKSILVDMREFLITILDGETIIKTINNCGFGRIVGDNNQTPIIVDGEISEWKRKKDYKSASYPEPDGGAPMNFALFLAQDLAVAFHEGDTFSESHGCIHLSREDAEWLFNWAGVTPNASHVRVSINGPHPVPGIRARVYQVGGTNMLQRVVGSIVDVLVDENLFVAEQNIGAFDAAMADAVEQYQSRYGLAVDGKVGSETALRMAIEL